MEYLDDIENLDIVGIVLGQKKEYWKVSEIGRIYTKMFGLNKVMSGEIVNTGLRIADYQDYNVTDEDVEFLPYCDENLYKKTQKVFSETDIVNYFIWHYSIILLMLDIDLKLSAKNNLDRAIEKIEFLRLAEIEDVKMSVLERTLKGIIKAHRQQNKNVK